VATGTALEVGVEGCVDTGVGARGGGVMVAGSVGGEVGDGVSVGKDVAVGGGSVAVGVAGTGVGVPAPASSWMTSADAAVRPAPSRNWT
jgi:hypothetical protein